MTKVKQMNSIFKFKFYKMTKSQKKYLKELRIKFKNKEITIEEGHKLWEQHPDYIKQYGKNHTQEIGRREK